MTLVGVKKEIRDLKKGYAPNFKQIEELLRTDPRTLTDHELFRCIQYYNPEIKTEEELTDDILEKMVTGEYP
ncbi:hypothetical protein [Methanosarcina mazei]|uniref:Uncharacterized protein n=1 Tax=Methanosarcina mazei TaxID=2209 RepID=A0A0F8GCR7_METMZ|nr:hypothetical protein [Methanosarcina mazei]KKG49237.1 hypothetical protein DU33_16130 [Methanosarcina mazei]KKG62236.1 hypothetical protein DU45_19070 [Methanosarcina mazei]KKG66207.1 hypothetical protein DU64_15445 [Methanosarcina mazei]